MEDAAEFEAQESKHIQQILDYLFRTFKPCRRPVVNTFPSFTSYAWDEFDVKTCLTILKSEEKSYKGHHEMLLAALCAWLIAPDNIQFRKRAILFRALDVLGDAEKFANKMVPKQLNHLAHLLSAMTVLDPAFYQDFYNPVGGLAAFKQLLEPMDSSPIVLAGSKELVTIVQFMSILHFYYDNLYTKSEGFPASINKVCKLVELVYRNGSIAGGANRTEVKRRFARHRPATSLIYAAFITKTKDGRTILTHIQEGSLNYSEHHLYIRQWLSCATFVRIKILPSLEYTHDDLINAKSLPLNEMKRFPSLDFNSHDETLIYHEFDQHRKLSNRGSNERASRANSRKSRV